MHPDLDPRVFQALGDAQRLGFLGAAPIDDVVAHARRFGDALPDDVATIVDVGAGGGTPGLILAADRPEVELVLLDRRTRRTDFLLRCVVRLGWSSRVRVLPGDASELAWDPQWRGRFDAAVARGLGAPAVTAELCRGFVRDDGVMVVSEPPDETGAVRWDDAGLAALGWRLDGTAPGVVRHRAVGPPPADVPRRSRQLSPRW